MWCFKTNRRKAVSVRHSVSCTYAATRRPKRKEVLSLFFITIAVCLPAKGRIDSEIAKEYFEIAQAYTELSKYDKAATFYLKAAKDPGHKNAAEYNLARVYGLSGEWDKAKSLLERQYKEAPGNILILKAYAYSLAASGDEERACAMYKKLYDEDTETPESALNYARILVMAKRYDEAHTLIEDLKVRFTEAPEKKALDELEEKMKEAQEEEQKEEPTEKQEEGQKEEPAEKQKEGQKEELPEKQEEAQKETPMKKQEDKKST